MTIIRRSLVLASLLALTLPAAVSAAPTAVDVRIEGRSSTIFDGPVTTDAKVVNPTTGGAHLCDGTNFGANLTAGPTPTTALDDAAIKGGFTWGAEWFGPGFPDYAIGRVASEAATETEFWGVFVNGVDPGVGGCQKLLTDGNEVLWAFDAFSKTGALRLAAPGATLPGVPIVATATNLATGAPVSGATVGSATTDADGNASVAFADPGIYTLKADRPDLVRSRGVRVCVDPPGAEQCTAGDKTAPSMRLDVPALASDLTRLASAIPLSWQGDDGAGSGIKRYTVEVRHVGEPDSAWRPLLPEGRGTKGLLAGAGGVTYELRARAYDRAANVGSATATTVVPLDNLSRRVRFSKRGWKVLRRNQAWNLSTSRATRKGASLSLKFKGTQATLITRKLRRGGKVRVTVDGRSRVVSLRGNSKQRKTLVDSSKLDAGEHTLRVTSLGRAPVEIDAIAIRP
jgi:hypothetical protein